MIRVDSVAVRSLRRELGMTQREFARRIGTARATVQRYEGNVTRPPKRTAERIKELWLVNEERKRRLASPRTKAMIAKLNI